MEETAQKGDRTEKAVREQAQAQLVSAFENMPNKVPLLLFAMPGTNDEFCEVTRGFIRSIRKFTSRVDLREFDLKHKKAKKYDVKHSPTIFFDPDHYNIRWLGSPAGEEGKTMVEALMMLGYRQTDLGDKSRKILDRIRSPRHLMVFVSPSCPYCPQQAVNALKAAIERPEFVSLEIIDIQANPDLADQYDAQSVPQTFANGTLIAMGAQPEELFMASLEKMEQQTVYIPESDAEEVECDLVIVGGGPAGLTAGIYAARSGLKSVIVERGVLGGQVATTPIVENYPGFTQVGGKTLVDIMVSHALEYVNIFPNEEVMEIEPGEPIVITTNRRRFKTTAVILATGASHRHLDVPGETRFSGRGVSYCATCDGPLFRGKRVIIVGGGDSAVTEALHLRNVGVDVKIVHRRDRLRAQEHLTRNLEANGIHVVYDTQVKEITGNESVEGVILYNNRTGDTTNMAVDGVFISVGYEPATVLAQKIGAEITSDGYIKRDSRHRTTVPGIYSAGDVEGGYKQIVTAAGQGSEAALSVFEDLVNPYWQSKSDR